MPEGLTIGVLENMLNAEGMDPEVKNLVALAIKELEKLGAKIKFIKIPAIDYGAAVYLF